MRLSLKTTWINFKKVIANKDLMFFHYLYSLFRTYFIIFYCMYILQNKISIIFGVLSLLFYAFYEIRSSLDFYNEDQVKNGFEPVKYWAYLKGNKKLLCKEFLCGFLWVLLLTAFCFSLISFSSAMATNGSGVLVWILGVFFSLGLLAFLNVENQYSLFKILTNEKYKRNGITKKLFGLWKGYFASYYFLLLFTLLPVFFIIIQNADVKNLVLCLFIYAFWFVIFHDMASTYIFNFKYERDQSSMGRKTKAIQLAEAKRFSVDNLLGFGGANISLNKKKKKYKRKKKLRFGEALCGKFKR